MNALVFHVFPMLAVLLYLGAACFYALGAFRKRQLSPLIPRSVLTAAAFFHAVFLAWQESHPLAFKPSFADSLATISCLFVVLFLLLERRWKISLLGAFVAPVAAFLFILSGVLFHVDSPGTPVLQDSPLIWLHVGTAVLAHVSLLFAFCVSVALILQEYVLRRKRIFFDKEQLPSLVVLDSLHGKALTVGFLLMLLGVFLGCLMAILQGVSLALTDSRVFWSFLTLFVYSLLMLLRVSHGIRGSRAAWWSVFGFCVLVASFLSVNIFGEGFHVH